VTQCDLIITGSEGFLGRKLKTAFEAEGIKIQGLDLILGDDLTNPKYVREILSKIDCTRLLNLHAINDHKDAATIDNSLANYSLESFTEVLNTNVISVFSVCREFIFSRSGGRIVNMSSIYGVVSPSPNLYLPDEKNIAYGVSKAALIQLSRHLAVHFAPSFAINSIILGGVYRSHSKEFTKKYSSMTPVGRMGMVEDLFPLVRTLLFEQTDFLTGSTITLDGGYTST
jgi:NAD(P)-dependent dehydrogenase (short-subunit alcohol dehydrogenase family)